jgi:hypothetical protein
MRKGELMSPGWFWIVLCISLWTPNRTAADDYLKLKLLNNGQALEARVARYDFAEQSVTLVSREGREVIVAVSELGTPDKRLILKAIERQMLQKPSRAPEAAAARKNQIANLPVNPANGAPLVWHKNLRQASEKAKGGESTEADRPIVWIRVLGDLRGLM